MPPGGCSTTERNWARTRLINCGLSVGNNLGLVNGSTPKKGTWEARAYWQHVEQYALDPNLLDSDFFEGRGNLEGLYTGFAYSFSDAMIGTVRYGWAEQIDKNLGTGGYNADLPLPNPDQQLPDSPIGRDLEIPHNPANSHPTFHPRI